MRVGTQEVQSEQLRQILPKVRTVPAFFSEVETAVAEQRPTSKGAFMSGILDTVQQQLTPDTINQIGQQLGIDPAAAQQAINAALPVVLGGLASNAQDPAGAAAIHAESDNHAGILGSLGGMLGGAGGVGGVLGGLGGMLGSGALAGVLGSVLGGNHGAVQDGVTQASGLDPQRAKQLMFILVPIVLAAIAHHKRTSGADATQVAGSLQKDAQEAHTQAVAQSPHIGGLLGGIMSHVMQQPK